MQETVNDTYALKRLQMENKELKESLELEKNRCKIVRGILASVDWRKSGGVIDVVEDVYKEMYELRQEVKEILVEVVRIQEENKALKEANEALKEENRSMKEQLYENGQLEAVLRDCKEKLFILTRGQDWERGISQDVLNRYRVSAEILCCAMEGGSVKDIVRKLSQGGGISVTTRRVNSVLSVKEDKDLLRVKAVFHQFPDAFRKHGISEEDMLEWFSKERIKKLQLVSKSEMEKRIGREALESMKPDPYVTGEFYDVRELADSEEKM
ncbi:hypothetical protein AALB51_22295 [Lachnospiraceae bacterium 62-26]